VKPKNEMILLLLLLLLLLLFSIFGFRSDIHWLKRSNSVKELAAFGIRSCLRTHGSQVRVKVRVRV
jgi:hypothetical protein